VITAKHWNNDNSNDQFIQRIALTLFEKPISL